LGLHSSGISAAFLGSAQRQPEKVLQSLEDGEVNLLYLTPEFIVNYADRLKAKLGDLNKVNRPASCSTPQVIVQWEQRTK
jgi:superfamily II DNA helicase RecQ